MKKNINRSFIAGSIGLAILLVTSTAMAQSGPPQISGLSETTLARSGRLIISGTNFGDEQGAGEVLIDGLTSIATTWGNTEIHAYVPEQASLGEVSLQVVTAEGASAEQTLTVTLRQADGRVRWKFQMDSYLAGQFTAVGTDGTVYATDNLRLYALTHDGGLKWVATGAGGGRPIGIGADGTIYTGAGPVHAVNPDGTFKWTYWPPGWPSLLAGPSLGPDGNIYATQDYAFGGEEELGMFSLDPDGNLRWSNNDDPFFSSSNGDNSAIKFGNNRLHVGLVLDAGTPSSVYSYDMDGNHLWNTSELGISGGSHPQLDPFGRIIFRLGQVGMQALSPDGEVEWTSVHPGNANIPVMPAIDTDGIIYTGGILGIQLWSINPDGSTRWVQPVESGSYLNNLAITPDNSLLFAGGTSEAGWVRGYNASDGAIQWQVDLPYENDSWQAIFSREQTFTPDGQTVYFTTIFGAFGSNGKLYAVNSSSDLVPLLGDVNLDGVVNLLDVAPFVDRLSTGTYQTEADINQDGELNLLDVQPFVDLLNG